MASTQVAKDDKAETIPGVNLRVRRSKCATLQTSDLAAFERIYQTYYRVVYSRCLRMTRSVSEAEDLTQDVFIQVFRKLKTFRGESSFSTWLHRLTVNTVLMHFRKPILKHEQTSLDDSAPDQFVSGNETYNRLSIVDRIALNEAIRQLSPGYRAVLILHDVKDMSMVNK